MKEIKRISMTDAAVESIKELITSGDYQIGDKLPTEASLCESLGISRTTLREAMRVLVTLGYVEQRPGKGAFVANYFLIDQSESQWYEVENARYSDFMEVRHAIETLSVRLAVMRATEKQITELEEIQKAFELATESYNLTQMIMLDELFHTKLIEFTRNQLLININEQLVRCFRTYRGSSFSNKETYRKAVEPHRKIVQCFRNKDPERAVVEMEEHLRITQEDMQMIHSQKVKA